MPSRLLAPALFLLVSLYALWPLGTSPHPHDHADSLFNTWLVSWNAHAALSGENPLDQPVFQGFPDGGGRSDLMLTQGAAALPLFIFGADPVRVHNLLMVFFLFLAGYAAYMLTLQCGAVEKGGLFAGTAVILLPWFQSHLWHLQLFSGGLGLLALVFAVRTAKGRASGWQISLFVLLQCLASLYLWYFMNIALALLLPFLFKRGGRKGALMTAAWFAAGNALCLPFLLDHLSNAGTWSMDSVASTDAAAFLAPWENSILLGWMRSGNIHPEAALWPGLAVTAGLLLFLIRSRRTRMDIYLLSCAVLFSILSLGPTLVVFGREVSPAPFRLLEGLPGASSIRLPARGAFFALVPMAVLAGKALSGKKTLFFAGMAVTALGAIHRPVEVFPLAPMPWHGWLAEKDFGTVLYLPMSWDMDRPETETLRLMGSTSHFTPSVNGYGTTLPENYGATARLLNTWPSEDAVKAVEDLGVDCIVVEGRELAGVHPNARFLSGSGVVEAFQTR